MRLKTKTWLIRWLAKSTNTKFHMWYYLIVFVFQVLFNVFKVMEIKFTFENQLRNLLINSVWINLVSLAAVYFSLDRLFQNDWFVLPFYIGGSVIGKWIAMTKFENTRFKIFNFLYPRRWVHPITKSDCILFSFERQVRGDKKPKPRSSVQSPYCGGCIPQDYSLFFVFELTHRSRTSDVIKYLLTISFLVVGHIQ